MYLGKSGRLFSRVLPSEAFLRAGCGGGVPKGAQKRLVPLLASLGRSCQLASHADGGACWLSLKVLQIQINTTFQPSWYLSFAVCWLSVTRCVVKAGQIFISFGQNKYVRASKSGIKFQSQLI